MYPPRMGSRASDRTALRAAARGLALGLALLVAGCATRVDTDFDPQFDFTTIRTWSWAKTHERDHTDPRLDNDLVHRRVRDALAAALAARGLRQAEAGGDVAVAYHLGTERKLDINTYTLHAPFGRHVLGGYQDVHVREYEIGTLLVELFDRRSQQLVWRGATQSRLHEPGSPEQRDIRAQRAAAAVLSKFPPRR